MNILLVISLILLFTAFDRYIKKSNKYRQKQIGRIQEWLVGLEEATGVVEKERNDTNRKKSKKYENNLAALQSFIKTGYLDDR